MPDAGVKKINEGIVVAVGPGLKNRQGDFVPPSVKTGQVVLLPEYGGQNVQLGKDDYLLIRDDEILGIIEEEK